MERSFSIRNLKGIKSKSSRNYIGIVTAVDTEFSAIREKLEDIKEISIDNELGFKMNFCTGKIGESKVVLVKSTPGKIDAYSYTQTMIRKYEPLCIINVGSAGTNMESNLNLKDCVISDKCLMFDVDLTSDGCEKGSFDKNETPFYEASPFLINLTKDAMKSNNIKYDVGTVITGDKFINDPKIKKHTLNEFDALCDDMEGAAVGKCCNRYHIPFVLVKCISDKPKSKDNIGYYDHYIEAADICAIVLKTMINSIGRQNDTLAKEYLSMITKTFKKDSQSIESKLKHIKKNGGIEP